jgi:transposase-like protein
VQTVSQLSRHLDRLVKAFQQAPLKDEWAYLFLDGVSLGSTEALPVQIARNFRVS